MKRPIIISILTLIALAGALMPGIGSDVVAAKPAAQIVAVHNIAPLLDERSSNVQVSREISMMRKPITKRLVKRVAFRPKPRVVHHYQAPQKTYQPVKHYYHAVVRQAQSYGSPKAYAEGVVGPSQFSCLDSLWNRESGWNTFAYNPSGAYGIPQALPGSKMASAGSDWRTNPITQVKWGLGYINSVYGSPCNAWAHSQSHGWY